MTKRLSLEKIQKDYVYSVLVVIGLALAGVLSIYFTHPDITSDKEPMKLLGITIPNFQGIIMRQPRAMMVVSIALIVGITAFIFISREALPFFSRPVAWGSVVVSGIAAVALAFLNYAGTKGGWFRFFLLMICLTLGATVLAEAMIFYRRFFRSAPWRTNIFHRIAFMILCALLAGAMAASYYHFAVQDGLFIDYASTTPNKAPGSNIQPNSNSQLNPSGESPLSPSGQLPSIPSQTPSSIPVTPQASTP